LALPSGFRDAADVSVVVDEAAVADENEIIDTVSSIHTEESDRKEYRTNIS
jgi:hypothetical protein